MHTPEQVMRAYLTLWNAHDEMERRQAAEEALTEDAVVLYPTVEGHGQADTVDAIRRFHENMPGAHFVKTSGIEQHHGWLRASWRLVGADGSTRVEGEDVAELSEDGRFCRVVGFRNPLPKRPSDHLRWS